MNKNVAITPLRWSIAHLNDTSVETLRRMKALGIGWTVQDAMYYSGEQFRQQAGESAARRAPPVEDRVASDDARGKNRLRSRSFRSSGLKSGSIVYFGTKRIRGSLDFAPRFEQRRLGGPLLYMVRAGGAWGETVLERDRIIGAALQG